MRHVPLERWAKFLCDLGKCSLNFWLLVRQFKLVNVLVDCISPEVSIRSILRHVHFVLYVLVSQLYWQAEVQVKEACLTDILNLGTGLTDFGLFVAGIGAWFPAEDCERSLTDLALSGEFRLCHADVWVLS